MSFMDWLHKALPITLLLLPAAMFVLYLVIKPDLSPRVAVDKIQIKWDGHKKITIAIFFININS